MSATRSPPPPADARASPREQRHRVLADARREHILGAAKSAFFELGLEGASLREIAKRAGYTAGAMYSYFSSKEDVYAALLADSLERLNARVAQALPDASSKTTPYRSRVDDLRARATAFFDFYHENPRDLDLGFYLFRGMQPRGLTPQWNVRLNARLRDALRPSEQALLALGFSSGDAVTEATALFGHIVGLLLLSHTGRIRMFGRASDDLFARYLDDLVRRAPPATKRRRR